MARLALLLYVLANGTNTAIVGKPKPALELLASRFAGADCGQKINAADASATGRTAVIHADDLCGSLFVVAVNVQAGHTLVLQQSSPVVVHKPIVLAGDRAALLCAPGVVLREADGASLAGVVENLPGTSSIVIDGCRVDGNAAGQPMAPFEGANGIFLFDVRDARLLRVSIENTRTNGIRVQKASNFLLRDSLFDRIGAPGVNATAIDFTANLPGRDSTGLAIVGNRVRRVTGSGNGIFVSGFPPGVGRTKQVIISNNVVEDSADECIELNNVEEFTVEGNVCGNGNLRTSAGIYLRSSSRGAVRENRLTRQVVGIQVDPTAGAEAVNIELARNFVSDCKEDISPASGGVRITSAGVQLKLVGWKLDSNRIVNCRVGIEVAGVLSSVSGEINQNQVKSAEADLKLVGTVGPIVIEGNALLGTQKKIDAVGTPRLR